MEEEKDNTMRNLLNYDAVKIEGPKKKILEFNQELNVMDEKELKQFENLCACLESKEKFFKTKIDEYGFKLLDKLISSYPIDKIFPCLDLYRIFLLHPDATQHYKKYEDGWTKINTLLQIMSDPKATDPAIMLSLRCLVNVFKEPSAVFVLRERR